MSNLPQSISFDVWVLAHSDVPFHPQEYQSFIDLHNPDWPIGGFISKLKCLMTVQMMFITKLDGIGPADNRISTD